MVSLGSTVPYRNSWSSHKRRCKGKRDARSRLYEGHGISKA